MKLVADKSKFSQLYIRWRRANLYMIMFIITVGLVVNLKDILKRDFSDMMINWGIVFLVSLRFYTFRFFRDFKRINHMVSYLYLNQNVTMETYSVSSLYRLIYRSPIKLTIPKTELQIAETPENWPLSRRKLLSENNFSIMVDGEQFYLIRTLFEDDNTFDQCVGELLK